MKCLLHQSHGLCSCTLSTVVSSEKWDGPIHGYVGDGIASIQQSGGSQQQFQIEVAPANTGPLSGLLSQNSASFGSVVENGCASTPHILSAVRYGTFPFFHFAIYMSTSFLQKYFQVRKATAKPHDFGSQP